MVEDRYDLEEEDLITSYSVNLIVQCEGKDYDSKQLKQQILQDRRIVKKLEEYADILDGKVTGHIGRMLHEILEGKK